MIRSKKLPLGWDFIQHYAASVLIRAGNAKAVFDGKVISSTEQAITGYKIGLSPFYLVWNYPPSFLLVVAPLSFFPYQAALLLWLSITLALYLYVVYRIIPHELTLWFALAFPSVFWTLLHGQNSFLMASLMGGALLLLESHPVIAGILLGCLTFKPQLFVAIIPALLGGRRWKALGSTVMTVILLVLLSLILFGSDTWAAFWKNTSFTRRILEEGYVPYIQMPTVYSAVRLIGLNHSFALLVQITISLLGMGLVWFTWARSIASDAKKTILLIVTLLATPYLLVHDLTVLGISIAFFFKQPLEKGWLPCEKTLLALLYALPIYSVFLANYLQMQVAPFILVAFLYFTYCRISRDTTLPTAQARS